MSSDVVKADSQANIGTVIRLEEEAEKDRSAAERLSEAIGRLCSAVSLNVSES
jgi:hypothetical protein